MSINIQHGKNILGQPMAELAQFGTCVTLTAFGRTLHLMGAGIDKDEAFITICLLNVELVLWMK